MKFEQRSLIESIDKSTCVDQFSESLSKRFSRHALIFRHLHGCKIRLRMQQCTVMHPRFLGVANFDISRSGLRKTREMTLQNAYGIQSASCAARCIPPPSLSVAASVAASSSQTPRVCPASRVRALRSSRSHACRSPSAVYRAASKAATKVRSAGAAPLLLLAAASDRARSSSGPVPCCVFRNCSRP